MSDPRLRLRPVRQSDLAYFDTWSAPEADPYGFFGHLPDGEMRRRFAEDGLITPDSATLLVEVGNVVVGDVGYRSVQYGAFGFSRAFEIGIRLLPTHRGRGHGSAAQRQLAQYLLATSAVNRVQASTDVENIPEQRALERAGFSREGTLRGAQFRAGSWHDLVMYSRLRTDE